MKRLPIPERLKQLESQYGTEACWPWPGFILKNGYGVAPHPKNKGTMKTTAHRRAYIETYGEISDDLVVDHKCRNRECVNPAHLQAVASYTNYVLGNHPTVKLHLTSTCKNGHPLTGLNVKVTKIGQRRCRICLNEWHREYRKNNPARFKSYETKRSRPVNYWRDYEKAHPNRKKK